MENVKSKFHFKTRKEKDAAGVVIKEIPAPEALEVDVPLLTLEDIVAILNSGDEKQIKLILEAANGIILSQAREQVNSNIENLEELRKNGLKLDELTFEFIANLPPATRRGSAISDETWEGFETDYVAVMQRHGKTEDKAKAGAKLLVKKFAPVKTNKKVLEALKGNLQTWIANTEKAEDFQEVYETLMSKVDTLLEKDEDAILAAI